MVAVLFRMCRQKPSNCGGIIAVRTRPGRRLTIVIPQRRPLPVPHSIDKAIADLRACYTMSTTLPSELAGIQVGSIFPDRKLRGNLVLITLWYLSFLGYGSPIYTTQRSF